jgi:hypothetical protein
MAKSLCFIFSEQPLSKQTPFDNRCIYRYNFHGLNVYEFVRGTCLFYGWFKAIRRLRRAGSIPSHLCLGQKNQERFSSLLMEFTKHFEQMIEERTISHDWVEQAIHFSDHIEEHEDGTRHYLKQIPKYGNRWLRVIVNIKSNPNRAITAFFDRRLRRKKYENKS